MGDAIVVTGAAQGIGRAIAVELASPSRRDGGVQRGIVVAKVKFYENKAALKFHLGRASALLPFLAREVVQR
jgi:NAD(P)-dependent dehydrogenase (short-subunit alcohol dehydrogenase family)